MSSIECDENIIHKYEKSSISHFMNESADTAVNVIC